jgi:hypothetical protein
MDTAFAWAKGNGGLCPWDKYKYTGKQGSCADSGCKTLGSPKGYVDCTKNNANSLVSALNSQPVSVAVDATNWQNYRSGIYSASCGTSLNHGVLAVGYDSSMWKVKNSWASTWGESGYIRLSRSAGGSSGQVSFFVLCFYLVFILFFFPFILCNSFPFRLKVWNPYGTSILSYLLNHLRSSRSEYLWESVDLFFMYTHIFLKSHKLQF